MSAIKGMVQVAGQTYRIVKRRPEEYDVFRILDDVRVGSFSSGRGLPVQVEPGVEPELLKKIAMGALKVGKITWGRGPALS